VQSSPDDSETVRSLRRELARIDRAIVMLLAARLTLAAKVIAARAERGGRETLRPQEQVVLERVRAWSSELDVPAELVESTFRSLIQAGKERYREAYLEPDLLPGATPVGSRPSEVASLAPLARGKRAVPVSSS
jgi:chorismate mutase